MKVLVIGGLGNIGERYRAILTWLGHNVRLIDWMNQDLLDEMIKDCDRAIIATSTDAHVHYCDKLLRAGMPFICEKPVSKDLDDCEHLAKAARGQFAFVVNNYNYVFRNQRRPFKISYDYYKTGKDGVFWDCCQLLVLDPNAEIRTTSPIWMVRNYQRKVNYTALEESYIHMLKDFLGAKYDGLWPLNKGVLMCKLAKERNEKTNRNPGTKREHTSSR